MTRPKRIIALAAIAGAVLVWGAPAAAAPRQIEATLSYQMLQLEGSVRPVSRAKFALLRSVLDRATYAALSKHSRPTRRREAIEALDAVQIALAQHNFIQPTQGEDWTDTLGDAFEPLALTPEQRRRLLAPGEVNGFRARYIDPAKPLYYVDDDIGSQLFISVGQRLGWDIRLVWVGDHYFVRWHLSPTLSINWDWTAGGPSRNEDYVVGNSALYRDWPERRRHLKSLLQGHARAHYLLLISRHVNAQAGKRRMLELAMAADPTHEVVQNSLAWLYATDPTLRRTHARKAVQYALAAWAAMPRDAAVADTAACAFAATGERALAVQIERFAIDRLRARTGPAPADYQSRLRQMQEGRPCSATPADEDEP